MLLSGARRDLLRTYPPSTRVNQQGMVIRNSEPLQGVTIKEPGREDVEVTKADERASAQGEEGGHPAVG